MNGAPSSFRSRGPSSGAFAIARHSAGSLSPGAQLVPDVLESGVAEPLAELLEVQTRRLHSHAGQLPRVGRDRRNGNRIAMPENRGRPPRAADAPVHGTRRLLNKKVRAGH